MPTGLDVDCLMTVPKDCWCVVVYLVDDCLLLWFADYGSIGGLCALRVFQVCVGGVLVSGARVVWCFGLVAGFDFGCFRYGAVVI